MKARRRINWNFSGSSFQGKNKSTQSECLREKRPELERPVFAIKNSS